MTPLQIEGSALAPLPQSRQCGPAAPDERLDVTLLLRPNALDRWHERLARLHGGERIEPLTREQFAREHGSTDADLQLVTAFADQHGLAVVVRRAERRTVVLAGTVAQMNAAFGVELTYFAYPHGTYRAPRGPVYLPQPLHPIVVAVLGLDNRPQARPHCRMRTGAKPRRSRAATPIEHAFTAVQIAALYGFPDSPGTGQCIALLELGGGYRPQDLQHYFSGLGLPVPNVVTVSVDHTTNAPTGNPNGADGEVMLDIEIAGAIVPAATIVVYFAPNTDAGFLDAVTTAIHDTTYRPSVVSISWGAPESSWTAPALRAMDQALQAAAALGVTVCVAAGDGGSSDGLARGTHHVDFPASSPHALACGGTHLKATASTIVSETVWNDGIPAKGATGGGVSTVFALPVWQQGLDGTDSQGIVQALTHRGIPDVAADADPQSGYQIIVDGVSAVFGGTSAVAPLWAGLIARINATHASAAGFLNALLYAHPSALRDITRGTNGAYRASVGWDACTGLGTPRGTRISALPGV